MVDKGTSACSIGCGVFIGLFLFFVVLPLAIFLGVPSAILGLVGVSYISDTTERSHVEEQSNSESPVPIATIDGVGEALSIDFGTGPDPRPREILTPLPTPTQTETFIPSQTSIYIPMHDPNPNDWAVTLQKGFKVISGVERIECSSVGFRVTYRDKEGVQILEDVVTMEVRNPATGPALTSPRIIPSPTPWPTYDPDEFREQMDRLLGE